MTVREYSEVMRAMGQIYGMGDHLCPNCAEKTRLMLKCNKQAEWFAELAEKLGDRLKALQSLVDEQAKDEGIWSVPMDGPERISEAYLKQELRRLHAAIESDL